MVGTRGGGGCEWMTAFNYGLALLLSSFDDTVVSHAVSFKFI